MFVKSVSVMLKLTSHNVDLSSDVPVSTPAPPVQNDVGDDDEDDEPPLNENDDDDLDDVDQGEELNTQHLVLAQFDKVSLLCIDT